MSALFGIAGIVGIILTAVAFAWATTRQSTISAAMQTIAILKTQVDALTAALNEVKTENVSLRSKVDALQDTVSGSKAVAELAQWAREMAERSARDREAQHAENLQALTRLEGGIARVETKILRDTN